MQLFQKHTGKQGFTLVEVLVVVLIAVLITLASVPVYKRNQERARYMAASGVLLQLGTAVALYQESCSGSLLSGSIVLQSPGNTATSFPDSTLATCPSDAGSQADKNVLGWLQGRQYLQKLPLGSGGLYKGYRFTVYPSDTDKLASMSDTQNNSLAEYRYAWVDRNGNITHNSGI